MEEARVQSSRASTRHATRLGAETLIREILPRLLLLLLPPFPRRLSPALALHFTTDDQAVRRRERLHGIMMHVIIPDADVFARAKMYNTGREGGGKRAHPRDSDNVRKVRVRARTGETGKDDGTVPPLSIGMLAGFIKERRHC